MRARLQNKNANHLVILLDIVGANAKTLSRISGVDYTLISKWQTGSRKLSRRSKQLIHVANAFNTLDEDNKIDEIISPYMQQCESKVEAISEYLVTDDIEGLIPHTKPPTIQTTGEYVAEYRVFLGEKGFRKATLAMVDYLLSLPPGQELIILCYGRYELATHNIPFVFAFITRLKKAIARGAKLKLINRKGYSVIDIKAFTGSWLLVHLKGYIRSRYYEGELPQNLRFVASIPGYLSAHVEEDPEVEDQLYTAIYTSPRDIRQDQAICLEHLEKSHLASQYHFLTNPDGDDENKKLWQKGPLPKWERTDAAEPAGNFNTVCRVPGFGVMSAEEFSQILGDDASPDIPEYLFAKDAVFAPGRHRIILCREDVRDGFKKERRMHEVLSLLLGRRVFIPRDMYKLTIRRLVEAMGRDDIEVALVPKTAFLKLQTELITYENSVSIAWLQDLSDSVYADDEATSGSFYNSVDYTWDKLMTGWKRKGKVLIQLRKWLAGKQLDEKDDYSVVVRNWDVMPKGIDEL